VRNRNWRARAREREREGERELEGGKSCEVKWLLDMWGVPTDRLLACHLISSCDNGHLVVSRM